MPQLTAELAPPVARKLVSATPTAWSASEDLPIGDWAEQGRRLGTIGRAAGWWIGDWLRYGNKHYGERYTRASRITGYDVQTLMNIVYVASSVPVERRRPELSFSHHAEVAALPADEQEKWLDRARADHLSVRCLREELRRERRARQQALRGGPPDPPALPAAAAGVEAEVVCPHCGCHFERGREAPERG